MTELIYVSADGTKILGGLSFMDTRWKPFDPKELIGKTVTIEQADDESIILAFSKEDFVVNEDAPAPLKMDFSEPLTLCGDDFHA